MFYISINMKLKVNVMNNILIFFFFQAEDGIRDAQESRGLGDVYKRQLQRCCINFLVGNEMTLKMWGCCNVIFVGLLVRLLLFHIDVVTIFPYLLRITRF
eukprot:TRINITY_DN61327_c0_g1_i1.p2 TRINITY_DN61327_c0_g1~~TRINITY_DN61327_c0_g1_i1.p2  ORF type:complete len:100 (+),score=12.72 TRINITY_DN61327_c0_g1_i1:29-328(+)